jgi:glycosyltransferase involved in cell wall biosynthesis
MGFPFSQPLIGFSSIDTHLDLDIVMASLAILARKYPSIKLIITGRAGKSVKKIAKKYGVQSNILLTGFLPVSELSWYLGCADVFVLPFPNLIYNLGRWPNIFG